MNHKIIIFFIIAISFSLSSCNKKESSTKLESSLDSVSYSWGVNVGQYLKSQGYESVNGDLFIRALEDVLQSKELAINNEKAREILSKYGQKMRTEMLERNKKAGIDFLENNKKNPGVITTPSGLQYTVIKQGNGPIPKQGDNVQVNYHGTLIDGTVFDSSVERKQPFSFQVGMEKVIKGWDEAIMMMPVGSKWKLFVPTDLAYGERPRQGGKIEPNMALIFEVELLQILPPTQETKVAPGQQQPQQVNPQMLKQAHPPIKQKTN